VLADFYLLYGDNGHPIAGLPTWLSVLVVVGGVYGFLRLIRDAATLLRGKPRKPPPD
jgi:hypothetical protein